MNIATWEFKHYEYEDTVDLRVTCYCDDVPLGVTGGGMVFKNALEDYEGGALYLLLFHINHLMETATKRMKKEEEKWRTRT